MKKIIKGCLMALFMAGFLVGCGGGGSDYLPDRDDHTPPTVTSTVPANNAPDVAINTKKIIATFDEAMNPDKITDTGVFTLTGPGDAGVGGAVTYSVVNHIVIFKPDNPLTAGHYTATISTGAQDVSGNALAAAKTWSFTVGSSADLTRPEVLSVSPLENANNVKTDTDINVTFSKVMDPESVDGTTFILQTTAGGVGQPGLVTCTGTAATFNPSINLLPGLGYIAKVKSEATDLAGNTLLNEKEWTFTTQ